MIVCNIDESTVFKSSMLELNSFQKFIYIFFDHYFLLRHLANKHNKRFGFTLLRKECDLIY